MDDNMVTELGEEWNRVIHRKVSIERTENGYIVKYRTVAGEDVQRLGSKTVDRQRVFITNTDMIEFLEKYFAGEPKP